MNTAFDYQILLHDAQTEKLKMKFLWLDHQPDNSKINLHITPSISMFSRTWINQFFVIFCHRESNIVEFRIRIKCRQLMDWSHVGERNKIKKPEKFMEIQILLFIWFGLCEKAKSGKSNEKKLNHQKSALSCAKIWSSVSFKIKSKCFEPFLAVRGMFS